MAKWDKGLLPDFTFTGEVQKKLGKIRKGILSEHLPLEEMNTEESRRALSLLRMEECLRAVDDPTIQEWLHKAVLGDEPSRRATVARLTTASRASSGSERKRRAAAEACRFLELRFPK